MRNRDGCRTAYPIRLGTINQSALPLTVSRLAAGSGDSEMASTGARQSPLSFHPQWTGNCPMAYEPSGRIFCLPALMVGGSDA